MRERRLLQWKRNRHLRNRAVVLAAAKIGDSYALINYINSFALVIINFYDYSTLEPHLFNQNRRLWQGVGDRKNLKSSISGGVKEDNCYLASFSDNNMSHIRSETLTPQADAPNIL
jgi:hypothetical protein